jgi:hypothetical protein
MRKVPKVDAAVAASVEAPEVLSVPTVQGIADAIVSASKGGRAAAMMARQVWGLGFALSVKPRSVEREGFNAAVLKSWTADPTNKPKVAVREMGEYRYATDGETVADGDGTALTPGFVLQYKGNALTKLKRDTPTLGALVAEQAKYFQDTCADAWRNLKDADASLTRMDGETKGRGATGGTKPFGERFTRDIETRILKPNAASFERGDTTAYEPSLMERAVDAMMAVLRKG